MKKYIFELFRKSPASMGLVILLLALHLTGVKDLRTPMMAEMSVLPVIFCLYLGVMVLYVLCILPKIRPEKREKVAWTVVVSSVFILTIIAKVLVS